MSAEIEALIVAAARQFVQTRPVLLWYELRVYDAAVRVAFGGDS